jgi:hypothetical protein
MVWDGVSAGVVKAERNEIDKQVIVGSVQTVSRENRLEQLPQDFDFIVTDEAHHSAAATRIGGSMNILVSWQRTVRNLQLIHFILGLRQRHNGQTGSGFLIFSIR